MTFRLSFFAPAALVTAMLGAVISSAISPAPAVAQSAPPVQFNSTQLPGVRGAYYLRQIGVGEQAIAIEATSGRNTDGFAGANLFVNTTGSVATGDLQVVGISIFGIPIAPGMVSSSPANVQEAVAKLIVDGTPLPDYVVRYLLSLGDNGI